MFKQVLEDHKA